MGDFRFSLRHGDLDNLLNHPELVNLYEPILINDTNNNTIYLGIVVENSSSLYTLMKEYLAQNEYDSNSNTLVNINGNLFQHIRYQNDVTIRYLNTTNNNEETACLYSLLDVASKIVSPIWDNVYSVNNP